MYGAACGTWVDVPQAVVPRTRFDLQLLAVRFVDPGHPEQNLGPRYRIWFRNGSEQMLTNGFNILAVASNGAEIKGKYEEAGVRVDAVNAGETQAVDIRLPLAATTMNKDANGNPAPYEFVHFIIDSHNEIDEAVSENNGTVLKASEILPVDPVLFSTDKSELVGNDVVSVAGEGLGPEPGKVIVYVNELELEPEIQGWFDLGVNFKVPKLPLAAAVDAEVVIVRGDGTATNPLKVRLK